MSDTPLVDLCTRFWPLHRTLVSDGMDSALDLLREVMPLESGYSIDRYMPKAPVWTWSVPERWVVHEATLAWSDGTPICAFGPPAKAHAGFFPTAHPLHLVSYSTPFEGDEVPWEKLKEHLHVGPEAFPDALPWEFKYYQRSWGFCLTYNQYQALGYCENKTFRVRIRTEFRSGLGDGLAVGVGVVPPAPGRITNRLSGSGREVLVCADLCHPYQVNDSITGAVAAIELARRLVAIPLPPGSRSVRFLFVPEVIGSICYLAHHEDVIARTDAALFSEMLGTPGPLVLQLSRGGKADRISRIAQAVLPNTERLPFRSPLTALNDEIVLNGPGVGIPTVALTRYPFPEYHTTADCPATLDEQQLLNAIDALEAIVRIAAIDWTPRRRFRGPIFLSRYGLWKDWRTHRKQNAAMEQIMLHLEGEHSIFDIAQAVDLPFAETYEIIEALRERGLVGEAP